MGVLTFPQNSLNISKMKPLNQFIKESIVKENFGEFKNAQKVATKIIDSIKEN